MLARCVATLKPPPELTLSQWADRYRMLSAESSAEPGRWHTDKAPYQREIMDAIGDAHIRRVVIMCAAQLGKTELLLNILGYFMAYAPAPILVMQPTLDMGQTFSKDRLAPMIRDTPVLRGLVDVKSRYAGNTILKKNFPGGHITIVGANSATGLASRPIKVLLADEVDRYPGSAGTEGDPLSLAQKRQTTFWDKKTVMVSTPVIKGHSRIETEYNQSTREEWNVPCPECGHYQPFVWANLIFDPDDLQKEIVYKCERCGCVANEYRWKQQSQQGRFVAENPGAETRGFHLNTLASTFCGWKEIVQKFIVAKEQLDQGNPEGMKVWVNTELGETWEERGEQVEDTELFNRREIYDAVVPEEVLVLTAGVDVQDDRFEVEIVGWGVGKESWGIRYQKIYGDMLKEQVWEDLDAFLQTVWCKKDGTALRIISCCIDSGGHHTDQVYRFTKERYERGVWAIKGKGGAEVPYIRNPTTNNRVKTPLFIIGVDAGKALLYQRLRHNTKGPNYTKTTGRRNVLHVMNRERAGQRRGVPMLAPVLEALKQLGRYTDAEITAAVLSAMFTVFVKQGVASDARPFGEMLPPDMLIDAQDQSSIELGPGAILSLNPGEDVEFADPKHPNTGYDAFTNALIRQIGAALEIPPEVLFKQFTTSYSAARGALNEFWRTCSMQRDWFTDDFCQPIYEEWFAEAVARGRIAAPGFFADPAIRKAYTACAWNGPARTNLNPVQEVDAAVKRVDAGFSTAQEETATMTGGDYNRNIRQRVIEAKRKREVDEITNPQAKTPGGPQEE